MQEAFQGIKFELAFSVLIEGVDGKSSLSYLQGSLIVDDNDDTRCQSKHFRRSLLPGQWFICSSTKK